MYTLLLLLCLISADIIKQWENPQLLPFPQLALLSHQETWCSTALWFVPLDPQVNWIQRNSWSHSHCWNWWDWCLSSLDNIEGSFKCSILVVHIGNRLCLCFCRGVQWLWYLYGVVLGCLPVTNLEHVFYPGPSELVDCSSITGYW